MFSPLNTLLTSTMLARDVKVGLTLSMCDCYLVLVGRLESLNKPGSYAGRIFFSPGRATLAGKVDRGIQNKSSLSALQVGGLSCGLKSLTPIKST